MGEGLPLWSLASMAWEGREPLRDWICLSVSLSFYALDSGPSLFLKFPEIRNSDWDDFWEEESTRYDARGGHEAGGAPQGVRRALDARGHLVRRLLPFFSRKKANIQIKIMPKFKSNRSYGSPGI